MIIFGHNIMKTVKELIDELKKFPEDAECFAYKGEDSGISIHSKDNKEHGFIFCQGAHFKERPTNLESKMNIIKTIFRKIAGIFLMLLPFWGMVCASMADKTTSLPVLLITSFITVLILAGFIFIGILCWICGFSLLERD